MVHFDFVFSFKTSKTSTTTSTSTSTSTTTTTRTTSAMMKRGVVMISIVIVVTLCLGANLLASTNGLSHIIPTILVDYDDNNNNNNNINKADQGSDHPQAVVRPTSSSTTTIEKSDSTSVAEKKQQQEPRRQQEQQQQQQQQQEQQQHEDEEIKEKKPLNILILYPDDWRHDSIEDEQPSLVHTPFLSQSLAKDGIRFTHNAVTTSICWISRATLFSGKYASQHMSLRLFCPFFTLDQFWEQSWPYILRHVGNYYVGLVGKWQYRNSNTFFNKAFDEFYHHEGDHWYKLPNGTKVHAADRAREDAIRFLKNRPDDQPFALTVAFYPPKPVGSSRVPGAAWSPLPNYRAMYEDHVFEHPYNITTAFESLPYFLKTNSQARTRFGWRYNSTFHYQEGMKNYFALISHVDDACRDIVQELKNQGIYNNTMIIFTTDNGLLQGDHGLAGKWHPWEESIRVPLIIYDPRIPQQLRGTTDDSFTLNVDLASTILHAANLLEYQQQQQQQQQQTELISSDSNNARIIISTTSEQQHHQQPPPQWQGRPISDLYLNEQRDETTSTSSTNHLRQSLQQQPWRDEFYYEFPLDDAFPASTALIRKKYKYIQWTKFGYEQLFDLENDPYELYDLRNFSNYTIILNEMKDRHDVLQKEITTSTPPSFDNKNDKTLVCKRGLYQFP